MAPTGLVRQSRQRPQHTFPALPPTVGSWVGQGERGGYLAYPPRSPLTCSKSVSIACPEESCLPSWFGQQKGGGGMGGGQQSRSGGVKYQGAGGQSVDTVWGRQQLGGLGPPTSWYPLRPSLLPASPPLPPSTLSHTPVNCGAQL